MGGLISGAPRACDLQLCGFSNWPSDSTNYEKKFLVTTFHLEASDLGQVMRSVANLRCGSKLHLGILYEVLTCHGATMLCVQLPTMTR